MKESDLHTKRTGHTEFVDKTSEAAKPINLESPNTANAADGASMDVDASGSGQSEGTFPFKCVTLFTILYVLLKFLVYVRLM